MIVTDAVRFIVNLFIYFFSCYQVVDKRVGDVFFFIFSRDIGFFTLFKCQIFMQRIQETGKMFENIDYVEWKGLELFYENEILEITIIYPKKKKYSYHRIYKEKKKQLTRSTDSKKIVNFYTKLKRISCFDCKVSQFSHPLNNKECGLSSLS